jgi:hypothetical protein
MATGSCQGIMKYIATTGIWPWLQLAAVVIGGKNGAEAPHTRIRPFSVRRSVTNSDQARISERKRAILTSGHTQ